MKFGKDISDLPSSGFVRLLGLFRDYPEKKRQVNGPVPGGTFWALGTCNDLPIWTESTRSVHLARREFFDRFRVWYRDAQAESAWVEIDRFCPDELFDMYYQETWDSDIIHAIFPNGLPEFYAVKKGYAPGRVSGKGEL